MLLAVWSLTTAAVSAFGVIFVAELGDKSQLLALGFGTRHRFRIVLAGLALGYAVAGAIAAAIGGLLGATLPERLLALVAGVLFLIVAAFMLLDRDDEPGAEGTGKTLSSRHVVLSIAVTVAVAEMGDKTQVATAALASQANPIATWFGATLGALTAGAIGALAGLRLGAHLDAERLRLGSAAVFAVVGVIVLVTAW